MSNAKTDWHGLWKQRDGVYAGQTIKKADVPPYAKLIVRYNKFYEKDSNRPKFVYLFASGDAAKAITVETTTEEYISLCEAEEMSNMRCFTDESLQALVNHIACYIGGDIEYGMHLVEDFVDGYGLETKVL